MGFWSDKVRRAGRDLSAGLRFWGKELADAFEAWDQNSDESLRDDFHPESIRPSGFRSRGEEIIADIMDRNDILFEYEPVLELDGYLVRPDFYLPEFDCYVEYWGMQGDAGYNRSRRFKRALYQACDVPLIELWPTTEIRRKWEYKLLAELDLV